VIARLNREINAILATPEIRQKLTEQGAEATGWTPEAFAEAHPARAGQIGRASSDDGRHRCELAWPSFRAA